MRESWPQRAIGIASPPGFRGRRVTRVARFEEPPAWLEEGELEFDLPVVYEPPGR